MEISAQPTAALRRQYLGWRQGVANVAWLALMHAGLIAGLWWGRVLVPWPAFAALAVLASLLHQRLLSEWFHEATHWNLVPERRWNDALADLLIGSFNGTRVGSNRPGHFRHHAVSAYFTPDDPDTRNAAAASRRELVRGVALDLCGFNALRAYLGAALGRTGAEGRGAGAGPAWIAWLLALHGCGLALTLAAGRPDIYPLYFLTLLCLYPVANRLRLYAQHAEFTPGPGAARSVRLAGSSASRSYHAGPVEQLLLHSPMIMYHHEHHAAPALPYRALRALSRASPDGNAFGASALADVRAVLGGLS